MLGVSGQQFQSMGQQVKDGLEAVPGACGASGQVDDQGTPGDPADAPGKRCKGCLIQAAKADLLGDPGDEAVTHIECGFRRNVALRQAGAAGGQDEIGALCGIAKSGGELAAVVGDDL